MSRGSMYELRPMYDTFGFYLLLTLTAAHMALSSKIKSVLAFMPYFPLGGVLTPVLLP